MVVHLISTHIFGSRLKSAVRHLLLQLIATSFGYQPYLTRQQSLLERGILNGFCSDLEVVYNNSYNNNRILNVGSLTGFSYLERLVFTVQLVGETELAIFPCVVLVINLDICV